MDIKLHKGFTILELIISIGIISVLLAAGLSNFSSSGRLTRNTRRESDFEQIRTALESFRSSDPNSSYPTSLNQLVTGGFLQELPRDPQSRATFPTNTYFVTRCVNTSPCGVCSNYRYHIPLEAANGTSFLVGTPLGTIKQANVPANIASCN